MARTLILLATLAIAVGLAGCANQPGTGDNKTTIPSDVSSDQARTMLMGAAASMPDKYGMEMTMSSSGKEVMSMKGSFDNASQLAYLEIKGDPAAFGEQAASAGAFIKNGLAIYTSKEGSLYLANKTAFVFPPSTEGGSTSFIPAPDKGPLGDFTNPASALGDFSKGNVTVKSVTPTTHRGKAAVEMLVSTTQKGQTIDATVIMFTDPARLAHVKTTLPRDEDNPQSPLSSATAVADIYYDGDIKLAIPDAAKRAVGLAYKSNAPAFGGGDPSAATSWAFLNSGGVALSEVEAQVKDGAAASGGEGEMGATDVASLPTLWSMKLSEGTMTKSGVTVTFTDADKDNKVSKGDSLSYSVGEDAEGVPSVILFDTVTGTYVVPGFGFVALVLGAAGVALALRRH